MTPEQEREAEEAERREDAYAFLYALVGASTAEEAANIWERNPEARVSAHDAIARLRAARSRENDRAGVGVAIKPLEWHGVTARSIAGVYTLEVFDKGVIWSCDGIRRNLFHPCENTIEAKAAAQADYEARIRSALLPTPPSNPGDAK